MSEAAHIVTALVREYRERMTDYADQNRADCQLFIKAIREGRIPAVHETL